MNEHEINPYCDVCGTELSNEEILSNEEFHNYEFPICEQCIRSTIENIEYVIKG